MSSGFLLQYMSFQKFFYLFVYSVAFYEDFYLENILAIHTLTEWTCAQYAMFGTICLNFTMEKAGEALEIVPFTIK